MFSETTWAGLTVAYLILGVAVGWWLKDRRATALALAHDKLGHYLSKLHEMTVTLNDDVTKHLTRMDDITQELLDPAQRANVSPETLLVDVVTQLVMANKRLHAQLDATEIQLQEQAVTIGRELTESRSDELTNLPNRRAYDIHLKRFLAARQSEGRSFSLLLVDIDHLKEVNERQGTAVGDRLLRGVAEALQNTVRDRDIVTRHGGEEFAVLLPETGIPDANRAAERLRKAVEAMVCRFEQRELRATISVGVAEVSANDDGKSLYKRADRALFAAKESGRNTSFFHDGKACHPILVGEPGTPAQTVHTEGSSLANRATTYARYVAALGVDARTDVLTGLPNRRAFSDELRRRIVTSRQDGRPLSLMLVGVDNLAKLNIHQGQDAVDQTLRKVAQVLCAAVRDADVVTRYGWEEFAVILSGTSYHEAKRAHARVQATLATCVGRHEITISTGLTELMPEDDSSALAKRCETALQGAKAAGGNCSHFVPATGVGVTTPTSVPV